MHHYQKLSDHDWAATFASIPVVAFFGIDDLSAIEWGPNRSLSFPDAEGHADLIESSGASLESTRQDLKDDEARMAALGLQMLVRETRSAETAEAKLLDKSESESALTSVAGLLERAFRRCAEIHADYIGAEPGTLDTNRDFHEQELSPAQLAAYSQMVAQGQLSLGTMWDVMVERGALPEDFDAELEIENIETPPPPALRVLPGGDE